MAGRGSAALKKRVQTLAAKGDDSMLELAEALSELRALPKPPDGDRPTLDDLVGLTKLSRRTICYLLKVWQTFSDLGIPREHWSALVGANWRSSPRTLNRGRWRRRSPWPKPPPLRNFPPY